WRAHRSIVGDEVDACLKLRRPPRRFPPCLPEDAAMRSPVCPRRAPACLPWVALLLAFLSGSPALGQAPLHDRIDQPVAAGTPDFSKFAAPLASDEEFLRRVTLDLTGTIPTAAQARAFLADTATDKRVRLIDRLLASPEHARHLAHVFDVMLMERRAGRTPLAPAWHEYLRESFAANKLWDQLVREILAADGSDPKKRAAA